ncbi:Replication initiator 1 [Folsomia candida]|uniref:Replication initiator 1 n=1 Tax=Folsomia candida TaxID=158441 RepID=A0A226ES86_FOLCA|nr:Replication initiator 1 [Folsomia candida]
MWGLTFEPNPHDMMIQQAQLLANLNPQGLQSWLTKTRSTGKFLPLPSIDDETCDIRSTNTFIDKSLPCDKCGRLFRKGVEKLSDDKENGDETAEDRDIHELGEASHSTDEKFLRNKNIRKESKVTHKTGRPFCCSICGLTFKRAHHLNSHEGTHRDDVARPFVCALPNCGKAFKLKKYLIRHEPIHTEHQCEICGKVFEGKYITQHMNIVHGKETFSNLIRVPAEVQIAPGQQVQTPTLVPVTAITDDGNNTTTITTPF